MRAQRQLEINGAPDRRRARPAVAADDGLYRYVPVPPVYRDAEGYPIEDGMSQNNKHFKQTTLWYHALTLHLPNATVGSDLTMPYREGDATRVLVPDLFVALRAPPQEERRSYRLWENPLPELVIEMLSKSTSAADVGSKRDTYEHLGIREYWLFDPQGFELSTPLAGYRLRRGRYRPIAADAAGMRRSKVLGLDLHVRDGQLRFRNPETGEDLTTYVEAEDRRAGEKRRANAAEVRADAAEVRADAAEVRADAAEVRAEAAEGRAEAAEKERMAEKERADAAERELGRLRSRLDRPLAP